MQGILKYMKGAGEPEWTSEDDDDMFGPEGSNLPNPTGNGKEGIELALADRLFDHLLMQQGDTEKNHFPRIFFFPVFGVQESILFLIYFFSLKCEQLSAEGLQNKVATGRLFFLRVGSLESAW